MLAHALQALDVQAAGGAHPPYLAVLALVDRDGEERGVPPML